MAKYIVCTECGFCLLGERGTSPTPKRVESCPQCDSTEFESTRNAVWPGR